LSLPAPQSFDISGRPGCPTRLSIHRFIGVGVQNLIGVFLQPFELINSSRKSFLYRCDHRGNEMRGDCAKGRATIRADVSLRLFVEIKATGVRCPEFLFHLGNFDAASRIHNSTQNPILRSVAQDFLKFVLLGYVVHGDFLFDEEG
jgi:hypothetical protein